MPKLSMSSSKQGSQYRTEESGISTDIWTGYTARMMFISVIPLLIVQIPQILNSILWRQIAVLIGLIVSLLLLVSYSTYQLVPVHVVEYVPEKQVILPMFGLLKRGEDRAFIKNNSRSTSNRVLRPWIQERKIDYVKHKHVILGFLRNLKKHSLGRLLDENSEPDEGIIAKLFSSIDANHDGHISYSELRALLVGINFDEIDLDRDDAVNKIMKDFDTSGNSCIEKEEFVDGISRWLNKTKKTAVRNPGSLTKFFDDFHMETKREHDLLDVSGSAEVKGVEKSERSIIKAVLLLLLGTIIAAAFADPLVDTTDNFADATGFPAFFISFIVLPLATSSRDTVSAIRLASQDKRHTASLSFSEIYATVTIHNVLSIPVFLALVYIRGLTWDFSSEVLVILIVSIGMGLLGSFRTHFPLWTSILAILLCPFSLALVYVLHYYYGWS
nr:sodium/calcium exchanger NCL-like [Quercus suber]